MPRIRTVKPEIWSSPQVMNLSTLARLLFIGMITQADDEGRGSADPRKLRSAIFPGDEVSAQQLAALLGEIEAQGLCVLYQAERHGALFSLPTWKAHQVINRASKSAYPPPEGTPQGTVTDDSGSPHGSLPREGKGGEGKGEERKGREGKEANQASRTASSGPPSPTAGTRKFAEDRKSPQSPQNGSRRNGDFERINADVLQIIRAGGFDPDDGAGIARALHVSQTQVVIAVGQLRDRGELPIPGTRAQA